jgi:hypothetical protein
MTRSRFERSKSFYCMGSLTVLCVSSEASAREACSPRPQAFINVAAAVNPLSGAGVRSPCAPPMTLSTLSAQSLIKSLYCVLFAIFILCALCA